MNAWAILLSLVLKPCSFDGKGNWTGELNTGLVVGELSLLNPEDTSYLVHLATMMGAFLELAQYDQDLYNLVEEREAFGVSGDAALERVPLSHPWDTFAAFYFGPEHLK